MSDFAKCGNPACGHFSVNVFVNSEGGGSKYCLDGCGYFVVIESGEMYIPKREPVEPPQPKEKKRKR